MDPNKNRKLSVESSLSAADEENYREMVASLTLSGVMRLCIRLSKQNKGVVKAFIEDLTEKQTEASQRLLEVEKLLAEQTAANLELSERVSKLEKANEPKGSKSTYAEQAAKKRPCKMVPKTTRDLVNFIRVRDEAIEIPSRNAVRIRPPSGVADPLNYLARAYDPGKHGINIRKIVQTKDDGVIVRLNLIEAAEKLQEAKALKDCCFTPMTAKNPKIILFGTKHKNGKDLVRDLFEQNSDVRKHINHGFEFFENECNLPERCWPGRIGGTYTWVVSVEPILRTLLVDRMRGKTNIGWRIIRIADYISIRCFKCQRYGHLARRCRNNENCGHCAEEGHSFRNCPNLHNPPSCRPCKSRKLEHCHSVKSKTCQTFLNATKRVIMETDYC